MKIKLLLCVSFLLFMSNHIFASENVIGWTISPMSNFPEFTDIGKSYGLTYTIFNNHPIAAIPVQTMIKSNGPFIINNSCQNKMLAPKGQANSACTIEIIYNPQGPADVSLQLELIYGFNRIIFPVVKTSSLIQKANSGRLIGYLPGYFAPSPPQQLANAGYTDIIVAFGVFSLTKPGEIVSAFDKVTPDLIKQMKQLGMHVLLSLGGASSSISGTTVSFHDAWKAAPSKDVFKDKFIKSLENLVKQNGFDGFDFDIEFGLGPEGPNRKVDDPGDNSDIALLSDIIRRVHELHPNWLLTLAPQTVNISATNAFSSVFANYSSLIMHKETYKALTWVGIQVYNSGTIYGIDTKIYDPKNPDPDASVALAVDLLESWPQGTILNFQPYISHLNASQVVVGYLVPNASGKVDGNPPAIPLAVIKRIIECLRTGVKSPKSCSSYAPPTQTYPGIGGVFGWQTFNDQTTQFAFAKGLKACVIQGNCQ